MVGPPPTAPGGGETRALRLLLTAQLLSQLGFRLLGIAMPILAATTLEASAFEVSAVAAAQTAAYLLVGLPAGVWVDRMRKRSVMIVCDVGRAAVLAVIPVAWGLGVLDVLLLCAVAFVTGLLTVFFDVAEQSYLPHVVGKDRLVTANARLTGVAEVAGVVGPGAGGLLVQVATAPLAVLATAFGYVWSAVCVALIRRPETPPPREERPRLLRGVAEGVRLVTRDALLRPIVLCSTTMTLFWSVSYAMLLVLLARDLAVPATTVGLLLTAGSLGGVLATVVADRVIRGLGDARAVKYSVAFGAPLTLLAALVQPGWRLGLVSLSLFGLGAALVIYNVAQVSYRQRCVPAECLGRVNATVRFFAWGARPVGSLCGGVLAEVFGARGAVLAGAVGTSLAFVWLVFSPLRRMRTLPTDHTAGHPLTTG
ncbi:MULTISPECIES: MFS transporter [unclassified Streptomyces]|uniref:MFS transporter n=1 Tax=unclassified Streptomyces TaxID=2593676 RepID=UPI00190516AC|nr:MFS transporter [Streptomyces sp. HSG2]